MQNYYLYAHPNFTCLIYLMNSVIFIDFKTCVYDESEMVTTMMKIHHFHGSCSEEEME